MSYGCCITGISVLYLLHHCARLAGEARKTSRAGEPGAKKIKMNKKEILSIVEKNKDYLAAEIKNCGKDFMIYISETGKVLKKHKDGWETGVLYFGGFSRLIYRRPTLKHEITPALVVKQARHDLDTLDSPDYLSPIEEIIEEDYYNSVR